MARTQTKQPAPKTAATGSQDNEADTGNVSSIKETTSPGRSQTNRPSLMALVRKDDSQKIADKLSIVGTVKQRLAEAYDLFKAGDAKADEANEIAAEAGRRLYQARTSGVVTSNELSAMLGDVWGFKPKSDGTPGKTPNGQGEAIRKRVVRAVQASDYVENGEETAFFKGLDENEVSAILDAVEAGEMSIYSAYDQFAALKRENTTRTETAFDPKKIAAIFEKLSEGGGVPAAQMFLANPALLAAYAALMDGIQTVDELAARMAAENEKTEAEQAA